jgi:hypothetical protein
MLNVPCHQPRVTDCTNMMVVFLVCRKKQGLCLYEEIAVSPAFLVGNCLFLCHRLKVTGRGNTMAVCLRKEDDA